MEFWEGLTLRMLVALVKRKAAVERWRDYRAAIVASAFGGDKAMERFPSLAQPDVEIGPEEAAALIGAPLTTEALN